MTRMIKRTHQQREDRRNFILGIVGTGLVALVVLAAINFQSLPFFSSGRTFHASFSDAGGLSTGDDVDVAGFKIGEVTSISLSGQHVAVSVKVTDGAVHLGSLTRAQIITVNVLGRKAVELDPAGTGTLKSGQAIPQSIAPYDITQALDGLTDKVKAINVDSVSNALTAISDTFKNTPPEVTTALNGLEKVASTISARDAELQNLLTAARSVTGVLSQRNAQITLLLTNGTDLLSELNARSAAIAALLQSATAVAHQLLGLVADQKGKLAPALTELNTAITLLNKNKANIDAIVPGLGAYATALGEAVGNGPYFNAYIPNLDDPTTLPIFPSILASFGSGK